MDDSINSRIGVIINALKIKKVQFAEQLKIDQSYVTQLTNGRRNPSERLISDICREFKISETWLHTGAGEMFDQTEETAVGRLCAELHASELESSIIRAYFRIDSRIREPFMQHLIQEMQMEYAALAPSSAEAGKAEPARAEEQKRPPSFPRVGRMI